MRGLIVTISVAFAAILMIAGSGEYRDFRNQTTYTVTTAGGLADADSATEATGTISIGDCRGYTRLKGTIYLGASGDPGMGLQDSAAIAIRCNVAGQTYLIDSTISTIPLTLRVVCASDTLLGGRLYFTYWSWDSLGDTVYTADYPVWWDLRAY